MRKIIFILALLLLPVAFAEPTTIVVTPGDSNDTLPPGDIVPTVDYIECPEGFSCIKSEDYDDFLSALSEFTTEINERTDFIGAVFERFDKKFQLDEEFMDEMADIAQRSMDDRDKTDAAFKRYQEKTDNDITLNEKKIHQLEVQVSELKATDWWRFLIIFIAALLLGDFIGRVPKHGKFLWRRFQEIVPIKFG